MVELAILLGIFSYVIFGLGIMGPPIGGLGNLGVLRGMGGMILFSIIFLAVKKNIWRLFIQLWREIKNDKISLSLAGLLVIQVIINLIGALGPELGFDALWYHLTIPKIYFEFHRAFS